MKACCDRHLFNQHPPTSTHTQIRNGLYGQIREFCSRRLSIVCASVSVREISAQPKGSQQVGAHRRGGGRGEGDERRKALVPVTSNLLLNQLRLHIYTLWLTLFCLWGQGRGYFRVWGRGGVAQSARPEARLGFKHALWPTTYHCTIHRTISSIKNCSQGQGLTTDTVTITLRFWPENIHAKLCR